jgi:hypothetical protein
MTQTVPKESAMNQDDEKGQSGNRGDGLVIRAEFIARQMKTQITPTEKMATSYIRNGLKKRSIRKLARISILSAMWLRWQSESTVMTCMTHWIGLNEYQRLCVAFERCTKALVSRL